MPYTRFTPTVVLILAPILNYCCPGLDFYYFYFSQAEERCLGTGEKPLLVQLNWHKDDREGRFLLRRADEKSTVRNFVNRYTILA